MLYLLKKLLKKRSEIEWNYGDATWVPDEAVLNERILESRKRPAKLPVSKKTKLKA